MTTWCSIQIWFTGKFTWHHAVQCNSDSPGKLMWHIAIQCSYDSPGKKNYQQAVQCHYDSRVRWLDNMMFNSDMIHR